MFSRQVVEQLLVLLPLLLGCLDMHWKVHQIHLQLAQHVLESACVLHQVLSSLGSLLPLVPCHLIVHFL